MAYIDSNPDLDKLFDPTTVNPPSLIRAESFDLTVRPVNVSGVLYRWLSPDRQTNGRIAYALREIGACEPWLEVTLNKIADFNGVGDNWDGNGSAAPIVALFATAEKVAEEFSRLPVSWRPTLNFDSDGYPNFAAYNDELYLSLTIESEDKISWYAVRNGEELFEENVDLASFDASIFMNVSEAA